MNRRNFFQSIIAGIGALVGHKILPKDKIVSGGYLLPDDIPDDLKKGISELPDVKSGESCISYYIEFYPANLKVDEVFYKDVKIQSTDAKTNKATD